MAALLARLTGSSAKYEPVPRLLMAEDGLMSFTSTISQKVYKIMSDMLLFHTNLPTT